MKLITLNYRYEERRSANYQSVSVSLEASVAIEDGDNRAQVLDSVRQHVRTQVRREVEEALAGITGQASGVSA